MFDVDAFISDPHLALEGPAPAAAVHAVVTGAMQRPENVADDFAPAWEGSRSCTTSPELTIIDVVWAPHMRIFAHDHRTWAVIGVYTGREDNEFFRRSPRDGRLVASNGRMLDTGDTVALGDHTIHAVSNPTSALTGAIHVYGGDFVNQPRSQ